MKKLDGIFCEIPCLTETPKPISGLAILKKWFPGSDKRYLAQHLQKFIEYNNEALEFLGVTAYIAGSDLNSSIAFRSSQFVGSVPLRSPATGKQMGDLIVTPRYVGKDMYEEYIEIVNLLDSEIEPEIMDGLPLASGRNLKPPMYLEAMKFIKTLEDLTAKSWRKFDKIEKVKNNPCGQVNWSKYTREEFKAENKLRFPVRKNILSELHTEYSQIRYVFDMCRTELMSTNTPLKVKLGIKKRLDSLEEKLYLHKPIKTDEIQIRFSDSPSVKTCKLHANKILKYSFSDSTAWRVDFSNVFEKFTQYIFKETIKEIGGHLRTNYRITGNSFKKYSWELSRLEPDAILQRNNALLFIDAKYKSHLYNQFNASQILKEEHRRDLHQILAYMSFSNTEIKFGLLCYPSKEVNIRNIQYWNPINHSVSKITILGLPLKKSCVGDMKKLLLNELDACFVK